MTCVVCESEAKAFLCKKCQRSYDRMTKRTHDIASVIEWAAKQARKAMRWRYLVAEVHTYGCPAWRIGIGKRGPCTCGGKP